MTRRAPGAFSTYLLLQIPDTVLAGLILVVLHRWAGLPIAWAVVAFVVWIVKDIAMYPLARSVFAPPRIGSEAFIGARGIAKDALAPVGYIKFNGELWRAESCRPEQAIPAGTRVVVRTVQGLTFLVDAETPDARQSEEGGAHATREGQPGQP